MVKLSFNMTGYLYQDGIRILREAYDGAREGMGRVVQRAYDEVDQFDAAVKSGADPQIERDEDGYVVDDYRDHLIYRTTMSEEALASLRRGFAITIFHQWERAARDWTKKPNGPYVKLCKAVEAKGYPIDPKLNDLHSLVNLLKHENAKWGKELHAVRPDYFDPGFDPEVDGIEWYEAVHLSDGQIEELFVTIEKSGPNGKSVVT